MPACLWNSFEGLPTDIDRGSTIKANTSQVTALRTEKGSVAQVPQGPERGGLEASALLP